MAVCSTKLIVTSCCAAVFLLVVFSSLQHQNNNKCMEIQMNRAKEKRAIPVDFMNEVTISKRGKTKKRLKQGKFIECLGLQMNRSKEKQVIPSDFTNEVVRLRDFLAERGAHVFLEGGSLLGWYRECSLIPHTTDFDLMIKAEEYSDEIVKDLDADDSPFDLYRIYGKPHDSLELGVQTNKIGIDLFFLYTEPDHSWVGGLDWSTRQKYKWTFPRMDNLCSGALYGRLFLVPCNVEEVLQHLYGDWRSDRDSSNFTWTSSHNNIQKNGFYTKSEMKTMRKESKKKKRAVN